MIRLPDQRRILTLLDDLQTVADSLKKLQSETAVVTLAPSGPATFTVSSPDRMPSVTWSVNKASRATNVTAHISSEEERDSRTVAATPQ